MEPQARLARRLDLKVRGAKVEPARRKEPGAPAVVFAMESARRLEQRVSQTRQRPESPMMSLSKKGFEYSLKKNGLGGTAPERSVS